jgi:hypothetical protein
MRRAPIASVHPMSGIEGTSYEPSSLLGGRGITMFRRDVASPGAGPVASANPPAEPIVAFFFLRLTRLLARRFASGDGITPGAARQLDKAIFATYRDLRALHHDAEARALLAHFRERLTARP